MAAAYRTLNTMNNAITGAVWRKDEQLLTISTAFHGDYDIPLAKMPQAFISAEDRDKHLHALDPNQQALFWPTIQCRLNIADVPGLANAR